MQVRAVTSFDHGGKRRRGQIFDVSENVAKQLAGRGLAVMLDVDAPPLAHPAGKEQPSSASPAGQASPSTTAKKSASGASKKATRKRTSKAQPKPWERSVKDDE